MTKPPTYERPHIATIAMSTRIFAQGVFVRSLEKGRIVVRVGDQDFSGVPVGQFGLTAHSRV